MNILRNYSFAIKTALSALFIASSAPNFAENGPDGEPQGSHLSIVKVVSYRDANGKPMQATLVKDHTPGQGDNNVYDYKISLINGKDQSILSSVNLTDLSTTGELGQYKAYSNLVVANRTQFNALKNYNGHEGPVLEFKLYFQDETIYNHYVSSFYIDGVSGELLDANESSSGDEQFNGIDATIRHTRAFINNNGRQEIRQHFHVYNNTLTDQEIQAHTVIQAPNGGLIPVESRTLIVKPTKNLANTVHKVYYKPKQALPRGKYLVTLSYGNKEVGMYTSHRELKIK